MDVVSHLNEVGPKEVGRVREPGLWARADRTAAVSELFMAHHRRLVGLASLFVDDRDLAEEVVQDAFLTLYRRWRLLRDPSAAVAYLNTCVVNGGRQRLRQGRKDGLAILQLADGVESMPSAEHDAVIHDEYDRIWTEIRNLPGRQREVVVLRYYLDQSEAEIADTLGVSRGSVKTHASRGLATLAQRLDIQP